MKLNILVGDVMTKSVKKVDLHDSIEKAAKIMHDDQIGSIVVTSDTQVKGIITATDIVYKHIVNHAGPAVVDIMSENPVKIAPSATIEEAARLMTKNSIEKLLVFDRDQLVGVITNNDILKVEPALVEILLEKTKMGFVTRDAEIAIGECESCGNFTDDIEDVAGAYLCKDCRMEE
ncbi:MAG: CBS domain-containing protein [Candidatus Aenigmarchaeota archaeon]|nr:CBS domain-containing protein [Candidatus Aenigmarchaeota archaeon]